jgi:hypothetical protein
MVSNEYWLGLGPAVSTSIETKVSFRCSIVPLLYNKMS